MAELTIQYDTDRDCYRATMTSFCGNFTSSCDIELTEEQRESIGLLRKAVALIRAGEKSS